MLEILLSFIFCGLVCMIGQIIYDHTKLTAGHITSLFVVIGSFLDLFHIYDTLVEIFHAGALVPITSFGHSLMHGVAQALNEYGILGIGMGMFNLTGVGITSAIFFAFIFEMIFKVKS